MKDNKLLFIMGVICVFASCAPKITTKLQQSFTALDYKEKVIVLGLQDEVPDSAIAIGTIKIGDSGFSTKCDWETIIEQAKIEARKAGGNLLKITEHIPPSAFGSSCDRIKATFYKLTDTAILSSFKEDINLLIAHGIMQNYMFIDRLGVVC